MLNSSNSASNWYAVFPPFHKRSHSAVTRICFSITVSLNFMCRSLISANTASASSSTKPFARYFL